MSRYAFFSKATLVLVGITLLIAAQQFSQPPGLAQGECQTFRETGRAICGRFLAYWQEHGGVIQQGYPISDEFQEVSDLNGQIYTVQYFERAVFEKHPENKPPYDVLLSQLGALRFQSKYPPAKTSVSEPQTALPSLTVVRFFSAMGFDGGVSIEIQSGLLSKRLATLFSSTGTDPYYGLLGDSFPLHKATKDAPYTDLSGVNTAWVFMLDEKGNTVAVFTLVREDGAWKIDGVQANGLRR